MSRNQAKKIAQKYTRLLEEKKFPVNKAYLFGSYAKKKNRRGSDIDVCVISPKMKRNWHKNEILLWRLGYETDSRIEPIGYTPEEFKEGGPLVEEIKKHGVLIR